MAIYTQDRKVWAVRGGGGLGLTAGDLLVASMDLAAESARRKRRSTWQGVGFSSTRMTSGSRPTPMSVSRYT
ncbi:MAG: hypothetical protein O2782_05945 [bacterium]|nr:hypothetical protein [bacterium]